MLSVRQPVINEFCSPRLKHSDNKQSLAGGFLSASLLVCYSLERQILPGVIQAASVNQEKIGQLLKSPLSNCVI